MKLIRIVVAVIVAAAIMYIARLNSMGQPEAVTLTDNGYELQMVNPSKGYENSTSEIQFQLPGQSAESISAHVHYFVYRLPTSLQGQLAKAVDTVTTIARPIDRDTFKASIPLPKRNTRIGFIITVHDSIQTELARFVKPDGQPLVLRSIGEVSPFILIPHILFMIATSFCVVMAATYTGCVLREPAFKKSIANNLSWAVLFCFLGCYPLGIAMNYFAFGGFWEGVPFGTDATDNKTQLLFLFLVFAALVASRMVKREDDSARRTSSLICISGILVMLFIYLIPHSIQFSHTLTYAFCYSWIGLLVILYLWLFRSRTTAQSRVSP